MVLRPHEQCLAWTYSSVPSAHEVRAAAVPCRPVKSLQAGRGARPTLRSTYRQGTTRAAVARPLPALDVAQPKDDRTSPCRNCLQGLMQVSPFARLFLLQARRAKAAISSPHARLCAAVGNRDAHLNRLGSLARPRHDHAVCRAEWLRKLNTRAPLNRTPNWCSSGLVTRLASCPTLAGAQSTSTGRQFGDLLVTGHAGRWGRKAGGKAP
jgi:hypothetical protein